MRYCLDNEAKGIHWECFDAPRLCPGIAAIGMLDFAHGTRSISSSQEVHPEHFEVHYVHKGIQMYQVDTAIVPLRAGELFICLPGQVHGPLHGIMSPATIYWVRLPLGLSEEFSAPETRLITRHFERMANQPCLEKKPLLRPLMDNIMELFKTPAAETVQRLALKNLSSSLIVSLLQAAPLKNHTTRHAVAAEKVYRIIKEISENPESTYPIPSLAKKCGICETLFRSLFKEACGYSPVDFIHYTRIEKAKKRLAQGISATEIAYELGYSSPPHFCSVFSKWTGTTPTSYLKKLPGEAKVVSRSSYKPIYRKLQKKYGS